MRKIISFSLWGSHSMYWKGALENIRLAKILYPEWKCRFYICRKSNPKLLALIEKQDCEIILMDAISEFSGLYWRFLATDDADIMICRDADSRLSMREVQAVNEWLNSDKKFHIMRDHPQHTSLIMGGMWGARNLSGLTTLIENIPDYFHESKGYDQVFLSKYLYPQIKNDAIIHDSHNLFGDGIAFPSPYEDDDFVGKSLVI